MARLQYGPFVALVAITSAYIFLPACGKSQPVPASPFPVKITLNPAPSFSLQAGTTLQLLATAQNTANSTIRTVFTFNSANPDIVDISPSGLACGGTWNAPAYTICTPSQGGTAEVTAAALGVTSPPTLIFVHPPINNIQVSVVPPVNSQPPACPTQQALPAACNLAFNPVASNYCLSQNQTQTLQAKAYDGLGNDITPQVGPFTWSPVSTGVVTVTPIVTITSYNVPTNEVTVTSGTPGQTQLIASASGAYSQPYNIEACPVQCIALELGVNGQQSSNQTSFVVDKGTSETITAYAVDVQGCIVPKPALTWVSSEPASIATGTGCNNSTTCTVTTPQVGAAAITASCTPPTCNIGFPLNPAGFPAGSIFIPEPVYPVTAISGVATGAASTTSILASSGDCYNDQLCDVGIYNVSSASNVAGGASQLPTPPNSLRFDPAGDKAFAGSEFGAFAINPANLGTPTNPFTAFPAKGTSLGVVIGQLLAISPNGTSAIYADNLSTPNQVYVVSTSATAATSTPLNLNSTTTATFSPDNLRAFVLADGGTSLYSYSALQFLQEITSPLPSPATQIVFNSSGTFALLAGGGSASNFAAYNTCDNSAVQPPLSFGTLTAPPQFLTIIPGGNIALGGVFGNTVIPANLEPVGLDFFLGLDNVGGGASTGIDVIATNSSYTGVCPQQVGIAQTTTNTPFLPFHINIGVGTYHPMKFFVAPGTAQAYIVASDAGVLIYNFNTAATSRIPLINDATPVAADISADGAFIYVAGSDGLLHQLNTALATDEFQTSFPPLPNSVNSFCFTGNDCTFDILAVKP